MRRLNLRKRAPGRQPKWRWTQENGKLVRGLKGGIDWYRYQTMILKPKLIPFALECKKDRPNTVVQEDKAPSHNHWIQNRVYDAAGVSKLLWPGNSPDLNMIEPCWFWMKKETTKKGAPQNRATAIKVWEECWYNMPMSKVQAWIERIPHHIQHIIRLEGGNEYQEGRVKDNHEINMAN